MNEIDDVMLTRGACYFTARNGDPEEAEAGRKRRENRTTNEHG